MRLGRQSLGMRLGEAEPGNEAGGWRQKLRMRPGVAD